MATEPTGPARRFDPSDITDPFSALAVPDGAIEPRPVFRAELRRLLQAALADPRSMPMTKTTTPQRTQPSWLYYFTIPSHDLDRSRRFYTSLFPDWQVAVNDDHSGFHVENVQPPMGVGTNTSDHPMLWFVVDDVDAAVRAVLAAGGRAQEPVEYASGRSADCVDDQGMHFSVSEPAYPSAPVRSTRAGELFYFNLPTPDDEQGKRFYRAVFGWEFGDYTGTHIVNTAPDGGLGGLRKGAHPEVWFRVDDLDAACDRVRELGGTASAVGGGPEGSHAWCTDDQGFGFGLSQPSEGY